MNFSFRKISAATALFATFAVTFAYVGASFAAPNSGPRLSQPVPAQLLGILTTQSNKAITLNGASAKSGATVPSGATIETPAGIGATIHIGALGGVICIAPGTKLTVDFDQTSVGNIKITLTQGCVILRTVKNTGGSINTAQGLAGQIDPANGGSLDVCTSPGGGAPTVNQGAAGVAGAGASAADCGRPAGAAAAPGLATSTKVALIGGITAAALTPLLFRGSNPSPFTP